MRRQIKHHSRSVSQFLIVGLLSCWVALIVGLLSYWLVVLRLIKSILKRKEKKEQVEETEHALIANTGMSPALSPEVEPEQKAAETKVEPEPQTIDTKVELEQDGIAAEVEPEPKTIDTKVELEQKDVETKVELEPKTIDTKVELEQNGIATKVKAEGGILATDAIGAYCVKCRQRQVIQGAKKVTTQKGRRAMEGTCPICGTKLFRFIAREKKTSP